MSNQRLVHNRIALLAISAGLCFAVIIGQLINVQVVHAGTYSKKALSELNQIGRAHV